MDTITDTFTTLNETFTKAVSSLQAQVLAVHREAAATFAKASELPSWVPAVEAPASVDALVEKAYGAQAERLEADKKFALDLIDVWTPKSGSSRSAKSAK